MRFRIRFADQIVGALIVFAFLTLLVVVVLLGRSQRWFSRDARYRAHFDSASGIAPNMEVQYRGFAVGTVKGRLLPTDRVEVDFVIFEEYAARVTEGSLVELQASPIGLGNRFLFYPGLGTDRLEEGSVVPRRGTTEAKELAARGLTSITESGDDIAKLLSRAGTLLEYLNNTARHLDEALAGTSDTAIGRIVGSVEGGLAPLSSLSTDAASVLASLQRDLEPILADLRTVTGKLAEPGGTVSSILDADGPVNAAIEPALESVTGILRSLERTAEFLPAQLPQLAALLAETRTVLHSVEGLLVALRNNPVLKKGFPDEVSTRSGGTSARNIDF